MNTVGSQDSLIFLHLQVVTCPFSSADLQKEFCLERTTVTSLTPRTIWRHTGSLM